VRKEEFRSCRSSGVTEWLSAVYWGSNLNHERSKTDNENEDEDDKHRQELENQPQELTFESVFTMRIELLNS
jgi:hypothetical protein